MFLKVFFCLGNICHNFLARPYLSLCISLNGNMAYESNIQCLNAVKQTFVANKYHQCQTTILFWQTYCEIWALSGSMDLWHLIHQPFQYLRSESLPSQSNGSAKSLLQSFVSSRLDPPSNAIPTGAGGGGGSSSSSSNSFGLISTSLPTTDKEAIATASKLTKKKLLPKTNG